MYLMEGMKYASAGVFAFSPRVPAGVELQARRRSA
jgi:hypothetical protein